VRFSRTLAVTPGHSKTGTEQARCPLTRSDEIAQAAVRFPPAPRWPKMAHLPGLSRKSRRTANSPIRQLESVTRGFAKRMDGGVQPPRIEPAPRSLLLSEGDGQTQRCEGGKGRTATRIEGAGLALASDHRKR